MDISLLIENKHTGERQRVDSMIGYPRKDWRIKYRFSKNIRSIAVFDSEGNRVKLFRRKSQLARSLQEDPVIPPHFDPIHNRAHARLRPFLKPSCKKTVKSEMDSFFNGE